MANRAPLGGSPLGLINLRSAPVNGISTFNGGNTRNVSVNAYNNKLGSKHPGSLFTGKRVLRPWPDIKNGNTTGTDDITMVNGVITNDATSRKELHNDSVYDTSVLNIIEKLSGTRAELRPADFAYLKDIGVYPNNRLMIARRFAGPAIDNIMYKKGQSELSSLAVLISWLPENQDFLDISFGEKWKDADADFTDILTSLGKDITLTDGGVGGLGGAIGQGLQALPLPGFTEIFQREFLVGIGIMDKDALKYSEDGNTNIPAGNPNLIKDAKQRITVGYGQAGSGLTTTVTIKMKCEYELKFISGIDPTIVWMDLLGMILRFGTSKSDTYGLDKGASSKTIGWVNRPDKMIDDIVHELKNAIGKIKTIVNQDMLSENGYLATTANKLSQNVKELTKKSKVDLYRESTGFLENILKKITGGLASKYRTRILGVINALSGLPSTPWHITIGNPLRPVFCSGDMLTQNVNIKLGPILAFNDLPSSIIVEFELTNARPWGMQEIMAKFNSGYLRTVDVQKTYYETNSRTDLPGRLEGVATTLTGTASSTSSGSSGIGGSTTNTQTSTTIPSNTKAVGGNIQKQ